MQLFRVSTKQSRPALRDNQIVFESGIQKLSGTFDRDRDYFLCKHEGRYFVSQINIDDDFGVYVDNIKEKRVYHLDDLDKMFLIKDDHDQWPDHPPTVSSK